MFDNYCQTYICVLADVLTGRSSFFSYLDARDGINKLLGCATCYTLFLNYISISYIFLPYFPHRHIQSVLDLNRGFLRTLDT